MEELHRGVLLNRQGDDAPSADAENTLHPTMERVENGTFLSPTVTKALDELNATATPISTEPETHIPLVGNTSTYAFRIIICSLAALILIPAVAVIIFIYVRRCIGRDKPYGGTQDDEAREPMYRDSIQLKDYESEGDESSTGDLAASSPSNDTPAG
ncbi:hypothetical protein JX265_011164 [Neoarthrinium moseri]|uniref:Uncharacterized protein n=2 Tax=Neoarthrinium moseri TaxID=1658444 RepID=A0A9Q0AJM8_9PEZI|nr:hypothetical protein JX265_011164 [Neoarthrinium moseri]